MQQEVPTIQDASVQTFDPPRSTLGGDEVFGSVQGRLANGTGRTFDRVEVRVYYLNAEGRRVGSYDRAVVSVSQMMFGDDSPLRPGYERDFDFPAANAPGLVGPAFRGYRGYIRPPRG